MSAQVEKLDHNMAKLTIEVSEDDLEKAIQQAYLKQRKSISIPGFRKGKVPRAMVERMYGKGVFLEDAANSLIPVHYSTAAEESELDIVSQPDIGVTQLEAGKPFIFTAEVAVKPPVKLGQYKGVEIPKQDVEVTDEDVDREIGKERERNSRMIDIEDRPVEDGDTITFDFEGFIDGEPFEGGKGEGYPLAIGSHSFIPGFEEQLIGVMIGEDKDVDVTFPDDYQAEELRGKEAIFKCKVSRIQRKELPEVDDDFAQDVSEFDTLEEYKADIRAKLLADKEKEAVTARENAAVEKVIEGSEMDIPEPMITERIDRLEQDFDQRMQSQGLTMDQYLEFTNLTRDGIREEFRPQAIRQIQSRLVLEKVAEEEDIQSTEEEVNEEFAKVAERYGMEKDQFLEMVTDADREQMQQDLGVQKALTLVTEAATEVEMPEEPATEDAEETNQSEETAQSEEAAQSEETEPAEE